jgi:hypothetical protein
MAIVLLIAGPDAGEPVFGPVAAERLAELGIGRVGLLADVSGIAVVLEGWAFDPARVEEAVQTVFPGGGVGVRILHDIEHVAVAPAATGRSA